MAFHEVQFPVAISLGATTSPEWRTEIVTLSSGHEQRNARWMNSKRRFNAGYGVKSLNHISEILDFFEQRKGRFHGFRYKDGADHKSCKPLSTPSPSDQIIATGDGIKKDFQLIKSYGSNTQRYKRIITKPIVGSLMISIDNIKQEEGSSFSCDYTTGIISFSANKIPHKDQIISAGFEFDTPVRFDTDSLEINLTAFNAGDIPSIPIIEIRL